MGTNKTNDRAGDIARYVDRVRDANPSLDDELATYRKQRRHYDEMRSRETGSQERELAASQRHKLTV